MTAPCPVRRRGAALVLTEHAIDRYLERIRPGIDRSRARNELRAIVSGAHLVKRAATGLFIWRGPKPRRLRLYVDDRGSVVTVMGAWDGQVV